MATHPTFVRCARLTGEVRYRAKPRLFRTPLIVMQVEEELEIANGPTDVMRRWRDALLEDFDVRRLGLQCHTEEALNSMRVPP
jgi:hypothetical protein